MIYEHDSPAMNTTNDIEYEINGFHQLTVGVSFNLIGVDVKKPYENSGVDLILFTGHELNSNTNSF